MSTSKPSAVIWYAQQPIDDPSFDFTLRNDLPRLVENPGLYDRVMLDVGRTRVGLYEIDFFRDYESRQRWATLFSLRSALDRLNSIGKRPLVYLGGWHASNIPVWLNYAKRGQLEQMLDKLLLWFLGPDGYVCDFMFDGTGIDGMTWDHVAVRCIAYTRDRGSASRVEGASFPPSVLAGLPSVTTAASAVNRTPPLGAMQAIAMSNSQGTEVVDRWRAEGREIFLPSHDIKTDGSLPPYWRVMETPGVQEAA